MDLRTPSATNKAAEKAVPNASSGLRQNDGRRAGDGASEMDAAERYAAGSPGRTGSPPAARPTSPADAAAQRGALAWHQVDVDGVAVQLRLFNDAARRSAERGETALPAGMQQALAWLRDSGFAAWRLDDESVVLTSGPQPAAVYCQVRAAQAAGPGEICHVWPAPPQADPELRSYRRLAVQVLAKSLAMADRDPMNLLLVARSLANMCPADDAELCNQLELLCEGPSDRGSLDRFLLGALLRRGGRG